MQEQVTASNRAGESNQFAMIDHPTADEFLFEELDDRDEIMIVAKMDWRNEWKDVSPYLVPERVKEKAETFSDKDLIEKQRR